MKKPRLHIAEHVTAEATIFSAIPDRKGEYAEVTVSGQYVFISEDDGEYWIAHKDDRCGESSCIRVRFRPLGVRSVRR